MTVDNKKAKRKPGGGRKKSKPDYNPSAILQNQIEQAVALYRTEEHPSLQTIANELDLNPIKVRKLLITAGVYKQAYLIIAHKASVTSYLPYEKGVYFPAETDSNNLSVGAERIRRMRKREKIIERVKTEQTEEALWAAVIEFQGYKFRTYSGLAFSYSLKKGRGGSYTKELFIDRRENSKSLAWSSVLLAFQNIPSIGSVVDRPKALGDIRGVIYIYTIFYRFGLIDVPEKAKEKMEPVRNKDTEQMSFV